MKTSNKLILTKSKKLLFCTFLLLIKVFINGQNIDDPDNGGDHVDIKNVLKAGTTSGTLPFPTLTV